MEEDLKYIKTKLQCYLEIIFKEYGNYINEDTKQYLYNNFDNLVKFGKGTISFTVKNGILYLPLESYEVFENLKKLNNYATTKKVYDVNNYLNTSGTYHDYIDSLIVNGLNPIDYFLESLLHETMHLCGSTGGNPLDEGINELVTRQLAMKYNLNIAAMGYNKEVEIAMLLQKIFGEKIISELTFINYKDKYDFIKNKLGLDKADLYDIVSKTMCDEFNYSIFTSSDPFVKADLYSKIDYDLTINIINDLSIKHL